MYKFKWFHKRTEYAPFLLKPASFSKPHRISSQTAYNKKKLGPQKSEII